MGLIDDRPVRRLVAVLLVLAVLILLFVGFGGLEDDPTDPYPRTDVQLAHYDRLVGTTGTLGGTVVRTDPVVIRVTSHSGTRAVRVSGLDRTVAIGDVVTVFGEFKPGYRIVATGSTVHPSINRVYMYGVSLIALALLGGLGWRYWTVSWADKTVEPRWDDA